MPIAETPSVSPNKKGETSVDNGPGRKKTDQELLGPKKQIIVAELTRYWNLKKAEKSQLNASVAFWSGFVVLIFILGYLASRGFDNLYESHEAQKSPKHLKNVTRKSENRSVSPYQEEKIKQFKEAKERLEKGIPTTREILKQNIEDLRNATRGLDKDAETFFLMELEAREYLIEPTYQNGISKTEFINKIRDKDIVKLTRSDRKEIIHLTKQRISDSGEVLRHTLHTTKWLKAEVEKRKLQLPKEVTERVRKTEEFLKKQNQLEVKYLLALQKLQVFLLTANYEYEGDRIVFYDDLTLGRFNNLAVTHDDASNNYYSFMPF